MAGVQSRLYSETFGDNISLKYYTTKPTTGLTKGDLMLLFHGSTPKLAVCSSTGAQTIKMIRLRTKSFGRLTA